MRIIDKHKDYYDHAAAWGVDPTIVYSRKPKDYVLKSTPFKIFPHRSFEATRNGKRFQFFPIYVYVAGDIHRGLIQLSERTSPTDFIWGPEVLEIDKPRYRWYESHDYSLVRKATKEIDDWAKEKMAPVILVRTDKSDNQVCVNTNSLKDVGFGHVVDGVEMFNKISSWIALANTKELVTLGNDERIVKAGFDKKISFKHPVK